MKLTPTHYTLLRTALGLSQHQLKPTRDTLPHDAVDGKAQEVADLITMEFLEERQVHGEGGPDSVIFITDAGRAALAEYQNGLPEQFLAPEPAPEAAPAKPARKPRAKAAPPAGDLLDAAPEAGAVVAFQAPQERAVIVLKSEETKKKLQALVLKSADIVEVKDPDGREQVHRMAMDLKKARTGITHTGKAAREDAQAFCTAVIEEERTLIAITSEEEKRLFTLRDTYDEEQARIEAERARLEAERVGAIRAKIDAINALPAQLAGSAAAVLLVELQRLAAMEPTEEEYAELLGEAALAIDTVGSAVSALYNAAKRREEEDAERVRLAAEEKQRLLDEAQRLADERARIEAQRLTQEAAALALQVQQEQQANAMEAISRAQDYAAAAGTAYDLEHTRSLAWSIEVDAARYGMAVAMVQIAKDMAARTLEQRIAALVAQELPAAWDEAILQNAVMSAPAPITIDLAQHLASTPAAPVEQVTIDWDEPAPLAAEAAPEPAPAPAQVDESRNLHGNQVDETVNLHESAPPAAAPVPANVVNYVRPNLEHLPMHEQRDDANAESHFCANLRTLLRNRTAENVGALFHQQLVMAIVEKRSKAAA